MSGVLQQSGRYGLKGCRQWPVESVSGLSAKVFSSGGHRDRRGKAGLVSNMTVQIEGDNAFRHLISVVSGDIMDAAKTASEQKTAQSFRNAIRTIFAGAEAVVWYIKSLALRVAECAPAVYSPFVMAALRDETYTVASSGKVITRPNFVPLATSIKLVISVLSRAQVSNADFDLNQHSIALLEESLRVRHRLTHPKNAADMDVTAEDFHKAMCSWAVVLTVALNAALEADKRLGTGVFPVKRVDSMLDVTADNESTASAGATS